MKNINYSEPRSVTRTLAKGYAVMILLLVGLSPSAAIAYLYFFQDPALRFEHHGVHEIAIGISLLQSGFIGYVTYRCYLQAKEEFLCWLALGFIGFTVIYGFHGAFTRFSHDHHMLFILYGPASRLVMAVCLLVGLMVYQQNENADSHVRPLRFWLAWLGAFVAIDALVYLLAVSEWAEPSRWVMEVLAIGTFLGCALTLVVRRIRSPLMTIYFLSILFFMQSSLAFLLGPAWSHMWWLAHASFATGFMALSYGVIQAFLTTGSFSRVYRQEELIDQVRAEKARAEDALLKLQCAHRALEISAATDALTGCANRREFEARAESHIARVRRSEAPLSFATIDLDHFKQINDRHGHRAGDEVLKVFVGLAEKVLRQSDVVGRIGGEEFALVLPDTTREGALIMAERLRKLSEGETVMFAGASIDFTVSIGVAQYGLDGETYEAVIEAADSGMYRAKQAGRNQVAVP